MPQKSSVPSRINFACSFVSLRNGTFKGILYLDDAFLSDSYIEEYVGVLHMAIAPSFNDFSLSGMTASISISIVCPNPWHLGHAPIGLLNENSAGTGSG